MYSGRLAALVALAAVEVVLRVALPWPMKVVVDQALAWAVAVGVVLQMTHQAVRAQRT